MMYLYVSIIINNLIQLLKRNGLLVFNVKQLYN